MSSSRINPLSRLVLPADRLSVHEVRLPPTPAHRLQAALAGALEEQLLDDPADLHFALSPDAMDAMKAGRAFEVMVCDKDWLSGVLAKAQARGQRITLIEPESREGQWLGWNLAQFDFRPRSRLGGSLQALLHEAWQAPSWSSARIALLALLVVNVLGLNVWAWHDRAQLAAGHEEQERILRQAYPQTPAVIDAPAQMAQALARDKAARGGLSDTSFETQLASKTNTGVAYNQIDYQNGELKTQGQP